MHSIHDARQSDSTGSTCSISIDSGAHEGHELAAALTNPTELLECPWIYSMDVDAFICKTTSSREN
jgi:hypothetical protein